MQSSRPVTRLSEQAAIHTYFDVVPESPDGTHVTYFAFDCKPLAHGTVMISERDGTNAVAVTACPGHPHTGAHQGWLDNEHINFSAEGQVHVAERSGAIVQQCSGAIDTLDQAQRRGLIHSGGLRKCGGQPEKEACWRVDLDSGEMVEVLDRETAAGVIADAFDLSQVPDESLTFKHTKWAPDGKSWFVVFNTLGYKKEHPETPHIKVIIAADEDGDDLRLIGSFGHHPNWLPDSSGIYAFAGRKTVVRWSARGGEPETLAELPCEGHPCVSPDGKRLACDGFGWPAEGQAGVVLRDLESGTTETLVEMDYPRVEWQTQHPPQQICHPHPVWSHDGRRLYLNAIEGELPAFYAMDL